MFMEMSLDSGRNKELVWFMRKLFVNEAALVVGLPLGCAALLGLLAYLGGKFFGLGLIGWLISFGYGSLIAGMWYGKLYSLLNTPILDLAARITRMATLFFPMAAANAASGPALTCLRSPSQHSNRTSYCTASDLAGSTPRLE